MEILKERGLEICAFVSGFGKLMNCGVASRDRAD